MILSVFVCILLLTLLCPKFGIAKNHTHFGVKCVSLKLVRSKVYNILQVCVSDVPCHMTAVTIKTYHKKYVYLFELLVLVLQFAHIERFSISRIQNLVYSV